MGYIPCIQGKDTSFAPMPRAAVYPSARVKHRHAGQGAKHLKLRQGAAELDGLTLLVSEVGGGEENSRSKPQNVGSAVGSRPHFALACLRAESMGGCQALTP